MSAQGAVRICAWVVTRHRAMQLKRCLESLARASAEVAPKLVLEIRVLVDVGAQIRDADTENVLKQLQMPGLEWICPEKKLGPAEGRNFLIRHYKANEYDWAFFIDDDAFVEPEYFERFLGVIAKKPGAAVIGGPNLTPPGSSLFQFATGEVLSYRFGNFLSTARYRRRGELRESGEEELILCNLMLRRDWVERAPFPGAYVCAEENRVLQSLKQSGAALFHEPSLHVFHERRENLTSLAKQVFKYGTGRGQNLRDVPSVLRVPHVLPSILFVAMVALLVSACLGDHASLAILVVAAASYVLACVVSSSWIALATSLPGAAGPRLRFSLFWRCLEIFPVLHASYALGVIRGLLL